MSMLTPEMKFYVALRGAAVTRRIEINGAVVLDLQEEAPRSFVDVVSLSEWIVLGPNDLRIELARSHSFGRAEGLVAAKSAGGVQKIEKFSRIEDAPGFVQFTVGPPLEGANSPGEPLSAADDEALRAHVLEIHRAIEQGDNELVMTWLQPRVVAAANRHGLSHEQASAWQLAQLASLRQEGLELRALSAAQIDLIPVCRGRFVRIEVAGEHAICSETVHDGGISRRWFALTFERAPDGWRITR